MNQLDTLKITVIIQDILMEVYRVGGNGELIVEGVFRVPSSRQRQQARLVFLAAEGAATRRLS